MKTIRFPLLAAACSLCALSLAAPAHGASKVIIKGHGFGHGIGLSQYGAYGMAKVGKYPYDQILAPLLHRNEPGDRVAEP